MAGLELVSSSRCFDGEVRKYRHASSATGCAMTFNIFLPDCAIAGTEKVPVLLFLSGLTCTEDNMVTKGGALPHLSRERIALVAPDTSPRGAGVAGEDADWELGTGASFYVDATQEPWKANYQMTSYVQSELQQLVADNFSVNASHISIFGHSMGGHGALVLALRNPGHYQSVSAFAPICHPSTTDWGKKQFHAYLGPDTETWAAYDATELAGRYDGPPLHILVDQGGDDQFYASKQLQPGDFAAAAANNKLHIQLTMRIPPGYDHSYWFVQSFMEDHISFHAKRLRP
ncbi:hypothetical protein IWQ57_001919 [Coemansia nantahalensis]|uniref:Uncharacterized protein n=1 Tax=Coemansia nantahalensis TaxID=2789366 RepID=A0ACC1K274_9FUNG|nr:hypothetical protein IWQ57_001919 [Coemansia nantahalensis]